MNYKVEELEEIGVNHYQTKDKRFVIRHHDLWYLNLLGQTRILCSYISLSGCIDNLNKEYNKLTKTQKYALGIILGYEGVLRKRNNYYYYSVPTRIRRASEMRITDATISALIKSGFITREDLKHAI